MHNDTLVVSLSMTRLQALLLRNAVIDSRSRCLRDIKRFSSDTLEYGDFQRQLVQLDDLSGAFIQVLRDDAAQTLAVLSISDDAVTGSHLEELDHV